MREHFVLVFWVLLILGVVVGALRAWPEYRLWQQELAGQAELIRAENNRKIIIEEAIAHAAAAEHLRQAEVIRARGVKEANDIIAEGFGGANGYLSYLFITDALTNTENNIVYVPTEASLPILEAGRFTIDSSN